MIGRYLAGAGLTAAILTGLAMSGCAKPDGWARFNRLNTITIAYPKTWSAGGADNRLRIQSSASAPIATSQWVAQGEVDIEVIVEDEKGAARTLDQIMDYYRHDPDPEWDQTITAMPVRTIPTNPNGPGCRVLKTQVVRSPTETPVAVPPGTKIPALIHSNVFCEIRGHRISVLATSWEGDKRLAFYQDIGLKMAKSIRLKGPGSFFGIERP